ncbi:YeeE/YedE family protein [Undibacterium sp. RTI2.1]|uniref:DUF6691 family protein n=1 Tax=unclassified Undibacterium TaxID=2630295 RepID=UPI002B232087|nr:MULTISPECIES: DUF6691 family protein [unclassified Undibacterium]MEB0031433.1 YeeE/YedE family protein [Undibacterium sp. RTI2.1]MEB0117735.1 YeeE/YedE family protein [Undibacterium sp. RTI2.2]
MPLFFSGLAGLIFGLGLILAGMADPVKVLGFLDLGGAWDPSLALVMAGAIALASSAFWFARRRQRQYQHQHQHQHQQSLLGLPIHLPTGTQIDRRLIIGSLLFGVGWGIAGICPGPALVLLGGGFGKGALFVLAMLAGMQLFTWLEKLYSATPNQSDQ